MSTRPIRIDSSVHPTLDGVWVDGTSNTSFSHVSDAIGESDFDYGCALGLYGYGEYEHERFFEQASRQGNLIPIAGFHPLVCAGSDLSAIAQIGFRGIKLHPGLGKYPLNANLLQPTCELAGQQKLVVFVCTYQYSSAVPVTDSLIEVWNLVGACPNTKFVLMHGGGPRLLECLEIARSRPNVLVDLSFTIMKFRGSSVDLDVRFALSRMDQKICIGSDYPDFSPAALTIFMNDLEATIDKEKVNNATGLNLAMFLGMGV